jgi:hypothetical protein
MWLKAQYSLAVEQYGVALVCLNNCKEILSSQTQPALYWTAHWYFLCLYFKMALLKHYSISSAYNRIVSVKGVNQKIEEISGGHQINQATDYLSLGNYSQLIKLLEPLVIGLTVSEPFSEESNSKPKASPSFVLSSLLTIQ